MGSFLRGNLVWILLSLFLSTALWIVVSFQQNPEETRTLADVPVQVTGTPSTMYVEQETDSVQLTVSAPRDVWPQLTKEKFKVVTDASKVQPGVQQIAPRVVASDPRARVDGISPDTVALRVEQLRTKQVPVQVITQGSAPFGYVTGKVSTTPGDVTVSGPGTSVDQVQVAVVQIDLNNMTKTIDETAKPIPQTADGTMVDRVTVRPDVLVEVPIQQQLTYKVLPVSPKIQGQVALGYELLGVTVDPQTVQVVGDPKTLDQMQVVSTQPVSIDGATADREVATTLALPGTVALTSPQSIVVQIHVREAVGSMTILVNPRLANQDTHLAYQITPNAVNVTVQGPTTALTGLQPDDIQVVVDVKGLTSGTKTITPLVGVPPSVTLVNVQPPSVTVTIK